MVFGGGRQNKFNTCYLVATLVYDVPGRPSSQQVMVQGNAIKVVAKVLQGMDNYYATGRGGRGGERVIKGSPYTL